MLSPEFGKIVNPYRINLLPGVVYEAFVQNDYRYVDDHETIWYLPNQEPFQCDDQSIRETMVKIFTT